MREEWEKHTVGSRMIKCHQKLNRVKMRFNKWRNAKQFNSKEELTVIQAEMEKMQAE